MSCLAGSQGPVVLKHLVSGTLPAKPGERQREVSGLASLGSARTLQSTSRMRFVGAHVTGPLAGITVLDFSRLLPGPYGTLLLADLGADVVRVTSRHHPDLIEGLPPAVQVPGGSVSAVGAWLHRGKRSIALDLTDPRGQEVARRLAATVDVVVEQFRPGVMARFGLDGPRLLAANPGLVYASLSGFGQQGPLATRPAHDLNFLALSGVLSYARRPGEAPPSPAVQAADLAAGTHLVIAVLAALLHRTRTGQGQRLDLAIYDAALSLSAVIGTGALATGSDPQPGDHLFTGGSLYGCYETRDGRYMAVGSLEPKFFEALCDALGVPDLASGGVQPDDLEGARTRFAEAFRERTLAEWTQVFERVAACVDPVLTVGEAFAHPQARARGLRHEQHAADGATLVQIGTPMHLSATPAAPGALPSPDGHETRLVLLRAGFTASEVDDLTRAGVLA